MVTKAYRLHLAQIGATDIDSVESKQFNMNVEDFALQGDGAVDPSIVGSMAASPMVSVSSLNLAAVLGKIPLDGLPLSGSDKAVLWFKLNKDGAAIDSGSGHQKLTINKGMAVLRSIQAAQKGNASIAFDLLADYDGTNHPFAVASASLGGAIANAALWTLGPAKIEGTLLSGAQSLNIDFGVQEKREIADGDVYPTFSYVAARRPKITLGHLDISQIATLTAAIERGIALTSPAIFYLRKKAHGGGNVADASTVHCAFTVNKGMLHLESASSSTGQASQLNLVVTPAYDSSNAIIVVSTAAAVA